MALAPQLAGTPGVQEVGRAALLRCACRRHSGILAAAPVAGRQAAGAGTAGWQQRLGGIRAAVVGTGARWVKGAGCSGE